MSVAKLLREFVIRVIDEEKFVASAPKRLNLPDIEVEADSTREAGEKASQEFFKQHKQRVDPMTVSLTPKDDKKNSMNFDSWRKGVKFKKIDLGQRVFVWNNEEQKEEEAVVVGLWHGPRMIKIRILSNGDEVALHPDALNSSPTV